MPDQTTHIDLSGIIEIEIPSQPCSWLNGPIHIFRRHYLDRSSIEPRAPDIRIRFGRACESSQNGIRSDRGFVLRGTGFDVIGFGRKGRKRIVSVNWVEKSACVDINIDSDPIGVLEVAESVIDFIVCWKAMTKGYVLVHGGAFACPERDAAVLICGGSGVGKSSTVLSFFAEGSGLLSDNFFFLGKDGIVMPFRVPLNLFGFNEPALGDNLLPRLKLAELRTKNAFGRLGISLVTKVDPYELHGGEVLKFGLPAKTIIVLQKGMKTELARCSVACCSSILTSHFQIDFPLMSQLAKEWQYYYPRREGIDIESSYESIVQSGVRLARPWILKSPSLKNTIELVRTIISDDRGDGLLSTSPTGPSVSRTKGT